ncbi:MAG: 2,4-dihydroxyhept-2-ene-1,7-dioic acid aldolase [Armatimonadota bacterium]|nr:MAG: 2,4-dihydroxyhept-2-ene-1,7-dioic acid aldolase [Armatimonadota bacterium]
MHMRPSRVLAKLRAGEVASCFKLNSSCARLAELVGVFGFDCIWSDLEHTANDWDIVEKQIWAAKTQNTDVLVRVTRGAYSDYIRPLELDAAGIMVPHIRSVEDAREVVRMTRFHPLGRRPLDGGNADGIYCNVDLADYIRESNEQRFVAVQIEDPEPLADLDAIASLEGIDILFFGPADFSHGLGVPGDFDHPRVLEARRRVAQAARQHGKFAGTVANLDNVEELVELGYTFLNIGADVVGLNSYCQNLIREFQKRVSGAVLSNLLL